MVDWLQNLEGGVQPLLSLVKDERSVLHASRGEVCDVLGQTLRGTTGVVVDGGGEVSHWRDNVQRVGDEGPV